VDGADPCGQNGTMEVVWLWLWWQSGINDRCGSGRVAVAVDTLKWRLRDWQWQCGCVEGGSG
jgi:hypothetical protein